MLHFIDEAPSLEMSTSVHIAPGSERFCVLLTTLPSMATLVVSL